MMHLRLLAPPRTLVPSTPEAEAPDIAGTVQAVELRPVQVEFRSKTVFIQFVLFTKLAKDGCWLRSSQLINQLFKQSIDQSMEN